VTVTPGLPSALHVMATVVRYEPKGLSKPAIYTFLGVATLPRFRGRARDGPRTRGARRAANPLRLLPREIVIHIARLCVISCATPPTPPSMRETASHPMTAAEHLAAGSLRTAAGALIASFLD
jgi:hypothetical protein